VEVPSPNLRRKKTQNIMVADPHYFNADPVTDSFFTFNADPDPAFPLKADPDPASQNNADLKPQPFKKGLIWSLVANCVVDTDFNF
jgi:hypothetical protein